MLVPREPLNDWDSKYQKWITDAPHLFEIIEKRAIERVFAKSKPTRVGVKRIIEDLRWDDPQTWASFEQFKWCNSFTAYVARDLITKHPCLKNFITVRRVKGEL